MSAREPDPIPQGLRRTQRALAGALFLCVALAALLLGREFASWREAAERELIRLAAQVQRETENYFTGYEELFLALAETECVRRRHGPECSALFARLQRLLPHAVNIAAVEADGRFFASGRPFGAAGPPDVGELPFFRALAAGAPRYVMDPHTGPVSAEEVIGLVVPLRPPPAGDGSEVPAGFGGLIGTSIRLSELSAAWSAVSVPPGLSVAVADRRGRILYASRGSPLVAGTALSQVPGLESLALGKAGGARVRLGEHDLAVRAAPVDIAEWLVLAIGAPGDSLGAYLRHTPLVWQMGVPIALLALLGVLFSWREVRAYRALAASEAELRRHRDDLEAFAYTVAHDLRAPLRAMSGFAQALREDFGDRLGEEGRDYAGRVVEGARRMDALVEDLLQYSRLARADLSAAPVDLGGAVQAAVADAAPLGQRGFVTVEGPFPSILAHEAALRQVIANLVSNALKFVPPDREPRVRVRGEERDSRVRLWVEDNGIGIASEHRERIFRVFERLHRAEEYPGTGIGLAIVERAIVRMGGAVGVESEPGQGSRFWVELPGA
ncbi:MAG: ATP-binding protein [Thermodesulfobacteriota bacterium]